MELEGGHRDRQQRASRLLVDNKLTVEIDYSEMHSTLRYAEAGVLVCNGVEAPEHSCLHFLRCDESRWSNAAMLGDNLALVRYQHRVGIYVSSISARI